LKYTVAVFSLILGYAVLSQGGIPLHEWQFCLLGLGLLAVSYYTLAPSVYLPRLSPWLFWPLLLLPCYILLQFIPLPFSVLETMSPARAEQIAALNRTVSSIGVAPLSLMPPATFAHIFRIIGYIIIFLIAQAFTFQCRNQNRIWAPVIPILAVAVLESSIGLLRFFFEVDLTAGARGTYANRNHFAGLLEMVLPFALMYSVALYRLRYTRKKHEKKNDSAVGVLLTVAILLFTGIVCSYSRTGFIATLCSLALIGILYFSGRLPVRKKWHVWGLILVLMFLAFVYLPPDPFFHRFVEASSYDFGTLNGRLIIWSQIPEIMRNYVLLGCGLGAFESAYLPIKDIFPGAIITYAHNDYLQALVELGIVGFVILLILMAGLLRMAIRGIRDHGGVRMLSIAGTGALAAIFIHSLVDNNLYVPANAMVFSWIAGIIAGANTDSDRQWRFTIRRSS
jgi:O-antigen ligase